MLNHIKKRLLYKASLIINRLSVLLRIVDRLSVLLRVVDRLSVLLRIVCPVLYILSEYYCIGYKPVNV